jgi:RHH-type transcriptional regulator, proline utilization regulon repressor / proline dehydrogenase / delta 1-pyrroline-5-carboxylate dehydrogenase
MNDLWGTTSQANATRKNPSSLNSEFWIPRPNATLRRQKALPSSQPHLMSNLGTMQSEIEELGREIFRLIDTDRRTATLFGGQDFYGRLMEWAMQDPVFKTQMFRFVDVLPALTSSGDVLKHMAEYLKSVKTPVSGVLRGALAFGQLLPLMPARLIRQNVSAMANIFICGRDGKSAFPNLRRIWGEGARFTVDILGEAVVSDREADECAAKYLELLDFLAAGTRSWKVEGPLAAGEPPFVNVSVKISALCARVQPSDPEANIAAIMSRLKRITARAGQLGASINLDMEHYGLKELTLELFKQLSNEVEPKNSPFHGFVIQAYLRDSYSDTERMLNWVRNQGRQFTIRLVKGAYWDFEKVVATQRAWEIPVYLSKPETDANYERITRLLLENRAIVYPAFASHNVRSIAHAATYARQLGIDSGEFEFQMLYGMATPIRRALVKLGYRVREYCPIGELVPGMAYLVRRLLENTSNEGFLRAKFSANRSITELLADPARQILNDPQSAPKGVGSKDGEAPSRIQSGPLHAQPEFHNEPPADFALASARNRMGRAIDLVRGKLGQVYPLVIGGKKIVRPEQLASVNPAQPAQIIGQVALGGTEDVAHAVAAARNAFSAWGRSSAEFRSRFLERLADRMRAVRYELAAWEVFEVGKTWSEADADVIEAIDFCTFYAQEMRRLGKGRLTQDVPGEVSIENYVPRGVAAIIAPWNFPLAILCGMTVAALVTGNSVVIKPAEQSSVIGAIFVNLLQEAGLPDGVANLVCGTGEAVGSLLVAHPDVDLIAFTGSREVGTLIWGTAAVTHQDQRNLKKVICEMGGKNAMIIDTDADLDEAVLGIIQSAFSFQGQKCSALSRLITIHDVHKRLVPRLTEAVAALKIGQPDHPSTDIGPVIDRNSFAKVQGYIELGKREHSLAFQAQLPPGLDGYYIAPAIFAGVEATARLAQEEIFGPVLALMTAKDLSTAIQIANDTPFALTGGFYSRSPQNIERVRSEFQVGNLYINRSITGAIVGRHPFGGYKMSGGGTKAGGTDYLLNFMFPRVVTENTLRHGYAPETPADS